MHRHQDLDTFYDAVGPRRDEGLGRHLVDAVHGESGESGPDDGRHVLGVRAGAPPTSDKQQGEDEDPHPDRRQDAFVIPGQEAMSP